MAILPDSRKEQLFFAESHLATFGSNAAALNIDPAKIVSFGAAIDNCRIDFDDMEGKRSQAKIATQTFYNSSAALRSELSDILATIKAHIQNTGDFSLWALADVQPPKTPAPRPAPPAPDAVTARLLKSGGVEVKWEGGFGGDVFFTVTRQLVMADGSVGPIKEWGSIGDKKMTDFTLPKNVSKASYTIVAQRGEKMSPVSDAGIVQVGLPLDGEAGQSSGDSSMPMAA